MKNNKINTIEDWLNENVTPEEQAKYDTYWGDFDHELAQKAYDNYGKPTSLFIEEIREAGFNPIGITVMICEETIIFETEEERIRASKMFLPEGWWYNKEDFETARVDYVNNFYNGIEEDAPKVYWLKN